MATKKHVQYLEAKIADLQAQLNAIECFAPPIRTCKVCKGYYPDGYVCIHCGNDNSNTEAAVWTEKTKVL